MEKIYKLDLNGRELEVSIGKLAEQADGACLVKFGDTVVLTTATMKDEVREGTDFFPLSCDYVDKSYSVGRVPGGFYKREGKSSDKAILNSRLIDRPIRPLFPEGFKNEVQVIATALSVEPDCLPEIVSMNGSSIALSISKIPFNGPTGTVNVGYIDGEYILNPDEAQREKSELFLVVSGTKEAIMMVEAGAKIVSEDVMLGAIMFGHKWIKKICDFIYEIQQDIGKEKIEFQKPEIDKNIEDEITAFGKEMLYQAMNNADKMIRQDLTDEAVKKIHSEFDEKYPEQISDINAVTDALIAKIFRQQVLIDKQRPDGRKFDEIRPLSCEVGILPRVHGTGLFKRGQTQVLTTLTLGSASDVQVIEEFGEENSKRYIHHYNFPPYSVGDVKPLRAPGRREIGHGALAERALVPVIPSAEKFPYTMRLVSEVLSSNGSSSQASVCGSTLALMDGGVPIKAPVAGIAMGLIKEGENISILTDIQGLEDHLGDMDFKVAGTREGITAVQMDIKIDGIDENILREALDRAKTARFFILDKIEECIKEPRKELSKYAPIIFTMKIDPEKIGEVIGSGGKTINKIIEQTGVKIDIDDDGKVDIVADNKEAAEKAMAMIEEIVKEIEVGEIYEGKVTRILKFGAFVELAKGKEGLLHISQIAHERTNKVEDVLKVGDIVKVKVTEIDDQNRINVSRKALLKRPEREHKKENKDNKESEKDKSEENN